MPRSRIIAGGMLRQNTPTENHTADYGLWVKREDLSCPPPGPPFSKTRGVYARIQSRSEKVIGVLDTYHSQAGHAAARACQILGRQCLSFYPSYKKEPGPRAPQFIAKELGAKLIGLPAGRSCILFHQARKMTEELGGYMLPNALKLQESVTETAKEVGFYRAPDFFSTVLVSASSGTIAAGVIKGFGVGPTYLIHLGYSRSLDAVLSYLSRMSGVDGADIRVIDEAYAYRDEAREGPTPPWPCNTHYDLKAFRWWMNHRSEFSCERSLFWNVG